MSYSLYFANHHDTRLVSFEDGSSFNVPELVREDLELNMGGRNTYAVLAALGFEIQDGGSDQIQIRELWAASVRYLDSDMASLVDNGFRARNLSNNFIECGMREGYVTEKVNLIKSYCELAMQANATHAYFA